MSWLIISLTWPKSVSLATEFTDEFKRKTHAIRRGARRLFEYIKTIPEDERPLSLEYYLPGQWYQVEPITEAWKIVDERPGLLHPVDEMPLIAFQPVVELNILGEWLYWVADDTEYTCLDQYGLEFLGDANDSD